jgi:hypothetical protein
MLHDDEVLTSLMIQQSTQTDIHVTGYSQICTRSRDRQSRRPEGDTGVLSNSDAIQRAFDGNTLSKLMHYARDLACVMPLA